METYCVIWKFFVCFARNFIYSPPVQKHLLTPLLREISHSLTWNIISCVWVLLWVWCPNSGYGYHGVFWHAAIGLHAVVACIDRPPTDLRVFFYYCGYSYIIAIIAEVKLFRNSSHFGYRLPLRIHIMSSYSMCMTLCVSVHRISSNNNGSLYKIIWCGFLSY